MRYLDTWALRGVAALLILAAMVAFGFNDAKAQSYINCTTNNRDATCPDIETAYAQVRRLQQAFCDDYNSSANPDSCTGLSPISHYPNASPPNVSGTAYTMHPVYGAGEVTPHARRFYDAGCPAGTEWDPSSGTCDTGCSVKPSIFNSASQNSLPICDDGCLYVPETGEGLSFCFNEGTSGLPSMCGATRWNPSGQKCDVQPTALPPKPMDPAKPTCRTTGADFNECVYPDGKHCVTGARGGRYCWNNAETGPRVNANGTEGASREVAPKTPTPPPNMQTPSAQGGGSTTINGGQYNTTNYGGTGNTGGQSNVGEGGKDPSTGGGSGEGEEDDGGTASGGGDCGAPPVCSGPGVLCGIIQQAWLQRCDGANSVGGGEGDIAGVDGAIADADAEAMPDAEQMTVHADPNSWRKVVNVDGEQLDASGFVTSRSCPLMPSTDVGAGVIRINFQPICDLLVSMSGFLMALAYFVGAKIIAGVK